MNTATRLLDAARARHQATDYRLAQILAVPRSKVSEWRSGKQPLPDHQAVHLAKLAGMDPAETLVNLHLEKAAPDLRPIWEQIARRTTPAALLLALSTLAPSPFGHVQAPTPHDLYIMLSRIHRLLQRIRALSVERPELSSADLLRAA